MGINERLQELENRVGKMPPPLEELPKKEKSWNLPFFSVRPKFAKSKKPNKIVVVWLGSDRKVQFKVCEIHSGIIQVGDYQFKPYEAKAIYHFKKWPVCVALEDRLDLVSGSGDELVNDALVGGSLFDKMDDSWKAKFKGLNDFAQQTIIRIIEKIEVDKELGKKKGKLPIVWIVIGLGILLYVLGSAFGVV